MKRLPTDIDIHTHIGEVRADAILCVDPTERECLPTGEGKLSAGIHPWNADKADQNVWTTLKNWLNDKRIVAIGEVGIDRLRGPQIEIQTDVFERQAELAVEYKLPLIIHCVRAFDILLRIHQHTPAFADSQWIVHGFRGKPELAKQLLNCGIDLSFGQLYNIESFNITPIERRYRETDTTQNL